jgi:hypothetical protein
MHTVKTTNILDAQKNTSYTLQVKAATDKFYSTTLHDKLALRIKRVALTISAIVNDVENEFIADRLIDLSDATIVTAIYQQLATDKRESFAQNIDKLIAKRAELDKLIETHSATVEKK